MGTAATLAMRLYQDRLAAHGWTCITPTDEEMEPASPPPSPRSKPTTSQTRTNRWPKSCARSGPRRHGRRSRLHGIPLGIQAGPAHTLGIPLIDTIDALARAAIAWAKPGALLPARR